MGSQKETYAFDLGKPIDFDSSSKTYNSPINFLTRLDKRLSDLLTTVSDLDPDTPSWSLPSSQDLLGKWKQLQPDCNLVSSIQKLVWENEKYMPYRQELAGTPSDPEPERRTTGFRALGSKVKVGAKGLVNTRRVSSSGNGVGAGPASLDGNTLKTLRHMNSLVGECITKRLKINTAIRNISS